MEMKSTEITADECLEVFKRYDEKLYNYYTDNMWFFGCNARNYAKYLKEKFETH